MRHPGQVRRETIDVNEVSALKLCADIDNGQSAAGIAANQLGSEIDVSLGEDVCLVANRERAICSSSKGVQRCPYHNRLLR